MSDRLIRLQGTRNLRDFGGYPAAGGMRVRRGMLYRSDALSALTDEDVTVLDRIGLRAIYDLRDDGERAAAPVTRALAGAPRLWSRGYAQSLAGLHELLARAAPTVAEAHATMIAIYERLPEEQAQSFAALLAGLADGECPLLLGCSAGKDRTGVAVALILHVLGVGREDIVTDYLVSNDTYGAWARAQAEGGRLGSITPEIAAALGGVDAGYLLAAFTAIEARHGSIDAYVEETLRLTPTQRHAMHELLLEPEARAGGDQ